MRTRIVEYYVYGFYNSMGKNDLQTLSQSPPKEEEEVSDLEKAMEVVSDVGRLRGMYDQLLIERDRLDSENKRLKERCEKLVEALKYIDKWWFDPSEEGRGCCGACEANLHPNVQGFHKQLEGTECPYQVAHDALASLQAESDQ